MTGTAGFAHHKKVCWVPEPSYVSYRPGVVFAGGTPVGVRTRAEDEFRMTAAALKEVITPRTKALILPYPNNPTGAVMTRPDLEAVAQAIEGTGIIVISDEIYSELVYGDHRHTAFAEIPGMWERTITLNGFSKAFAMTGWRMGYACAPRPLAQVMCKIHQFTMLCAPTAGQYAAIEALKGALETGYAEIEKMRRTYDRRRRIMVDAFRKMGLDCFEPKGAFYVFPGIERTGLTSEAFCEQLLRAQKVACVPGTAFGESGEGHIRCSYAAATGKIQEAMGRIARFVEPLIK